ncbi:uncharacterized protein METZ01_LOCUS54918 [marine metagenome]|uniref:Uncharacterized protein n=1 Tax=marine metagenome TaxID=408172 RepID=A0A381SF04_9ZZZZ
MRMDYKLPVVIVKMVLLGTPGRLSLTNLAHCPLV